MAAAQDTVPGLDRLTSLETVLINQRVSSFTGKGNTYAVVSDEEVLLNLIEEAEENAIISRGNSRGFHMNGVDNTGRKVLSLRRPSAFLSDKIELSMNDELVSVIRMEPTSFTGAFRINDAQDCPIFRLKGKICTNATNFQLLTTTKTVIGSVLKKNRGWRNEMMSRNDDYVITFPADLALHFKLAVIGACVLIDFRFHERRRP